MEKLYVAPTTSPLVSVDPKYADVYNAWNTKRTATAKMTLSQWVALRKSDAVFGNQIQAMSIVLMIAAVVLVIVIRHATKKMSELRNRATEETQGTVIKTERRWEGRHLHHYAKIQFTINEHQFTEEFLISGLKTGQTVTVCYNPDDIQEQILKTDEDIKSARFFMIIAILCLIAGIVMRTIFL